LVGAASDDIRAKLPFTMQAASGKQK